jgi:hypothetical protein
MDLYRAGIVAHTARGLERNATLWQQVLERDARFQSGTLAIQMQRLQKELHPLRIQRLRERAIQAHTRGAWSQKIGALQALLALEPGESVAKARLALAKLHLRYAWMYESALQFIAEQTFDAARVQLQMHWQEDPYYGDPAGLSLQIGPYLPQPPAQQGVLIGTLRVETGQKSGQVYILRKEQLSIGRSRESDIFLEDLALSRLHASIITTGNGSYTLQDKGSANGTKVNGQPVRKNHPYLLCSGDKIQLGQTVLAFETSFSAYRYPAACPA